LALKFLGETLHKLGRLDEALSKYQLASTLSPEDVDLSDRTKQVQAPPRPATRRSPIQPSHPASKARLERYRRQKRRPSSSSAKHARWALNPCPMMFCRCRRSSRTGP
jgi:hypothetical protein